MKKIGLYLACICSLFILASCGGSTSNGFKLPKSLDGKLGEYYNVKGAEIRPEGTDKTDYVLVVELEKNKKEFDFETQEMEYEGDADESDLSIGEWAINIVVYNADGEKIDEDHPDSGDMENLFTECSKPGQTKKIKMGIDIDKDDIDVEKTIVLRGMAKVLTEEDIKKAKEASKEMMEAMKETKDMLDEMSSDDDSDSDSDDEEDF
ncbi:MAG: hypothetical protein IJ537_02345 [Bacteroidaceae bacterium]|nr:hypothetical protein [Bacteroidaceae bacterium]